MGRMRKNISKIICCFITASLMAGIVSGCSPDQPQKSTAETKEQDTSPVGKSEGETDVSQPPTKLTLFLDNMNITEDSYVKKEIEKATNTELEIIQVTPSEIDNKLNIMLASGEIPDIFQCETTTMEGQLLTSGILLPINEYWDNYPNIKNGREEEIWDLMRYTDGNIYSVGIVNQNPLEILAYRKDWLDKFEMEVPKTLDEYYEFAKKVGQEDPDGDGIANTFAFGAYQTLDLKWMDHIFGAYGVLPNYWMKADGRIVNGSVQPGAKEALTFLNKMYAEGLIDPEFVTDDAYRWQSKVKSGVYGAGPTKLQIFDQNNWRNYYEPFIASNPGGEHVYGSVLQGGCEKPIGWRMDSKRGWVRTFIYKDSPNVEAAMRLLDYLMSEEGNLFATYGKEGEHYQWEGDKIVRIITNEEAQELDLDKFYIGNTTLFYHSSENLFDAMKFLEGEGIATPDPTDGIFIEEQIKLYPKLKDLTNTRYVEMIIGEIPIEEGFDQFVEEWNSKGGTELTEAMNQAYQERNQ